MYNSFNQNPYQQQKPNKTGADDLRALAGWLAAGGTLYCLAFVVEGYHQAILAHFHKAFDPLVAEAATWITYVIASGAAFYFFRIAIFAVLSVLVLNTHRLPFAFG